MPTRAKTRRSSIFHRGSESISKPSMSKTAALCMFPRRAWLPAKVDVILELAFERLPQLEAVLEVLPSDSARGVDIHL